MPKFKAILASTLILTACQSPSFIDAVGGSPEEQLANAELQMNQYSNDPRAEMLAIHSVDRALKTYKEQNNLIGLGNAYHNQGKVYKVFEREAGVQKAEQSQNTAISYYNQAKYNPGLAVAYGELMQLQYIKHNNQQACASGTIAIQKFEAGKTTHPEITIPVYAKNTKDFGQFVENMKKQIGCAN